VATSARVTPVLIVAWQVENRIAGWRLENPFTVMRGADEARGLRVTWSGRRRGLFALASRLAPN
jgi:hypothetical protein